MSKPRIYGTIDGVPITEDVIERLVKNAADGYPGVTARRAGRPAMGDAPAKTVAVRLEPKLHNALVEKATEEKLSTSQIMRAALRSYLNAS